MKKILLWTLAVLTLAPAQAQFSLRKNGQAIFGKRMNKTLIVNPTGQNTPQSVLSDNPMLVPIDTLASAVFLGKHTGNSGAYITFGGDKHLWIGEKAGTSAGVYGTNVLELGIWNGISGVCKSGMVFSFTPPVTGARTFTFYSDQKASSFISTSDSRLKRNVRPIGSSAASNLNLLSPVMGD